MKPSREIDQRSLVVAQGDKSCALLDRVVKKNARYDKRAHVLALTGLEVEETARCRALKIHRALSLRKRSFEMTRKAISCPSQTLRTRRADI